MKFIRSMFPYLLNGGETNGKTTIVNFGENDEYQLFWHEISAYEPFEVNGIRVFPFAQHHGTNESLGFRVADFAYSPDVKSFPKRSWPYLQNLDLWVLDCDYWEPSDSHGDPETVLKLATQFLPKRVLLTHMDEKMDYEKVTSWFAVHKNVDVRPAYDGMKIHFPDVADM